jgi:hypothetical protein
MPQSNPTVAAFQETNRSRRGFNVGDRSGPGMLYEPRWFHEWVNKCDAMDTAEKLLLRSCEERLEDCRDGMQFYLRNLALMGNK